MQEFHNDMDQIETRISLIHRRIGNYNTSVEELLTMMGKACCNPMHMAIVSFLALIVSQNFVTKVFPVQYTLGEIFKTITRQIEIILFFCK